MTGGESTNKDVAGLTAGGIVVEFVVGDLETFVVRDAEIMDHDGVIFYELVQGGRRGDLLDFALVLLLSEFAPEGIEGELAGGFFPLLDTMLSRSRRMPSRRTYLDRKNDCCSGVLRLPSKTSNVLSRVGDYHGMSDGVFVVLVDGGVEGRDIHGVSDLVETVYLIPTGTCLNSAFAPVERVRDDPCGLLGILPFQPLVGFHGL